MPVWFPRDCLGGDSQLMGGYGIGLYGFPNAVYPKPNAGAEIDAVTNEVVAFPYKTGYGGYCVLVNQDCSASFKPTVFCCLTAVASDTQHTLLPIDFTELNVIVALK